jgi:hypothetical protein
MEVPLQNPGFMYNIIYKIGFVQYILGQWFPPLNKIKLKLLKPTSFQTPTFERTLESHICILLQSFKVLSLILLPSLGTYKLHPSTWQKDAVRVVSVLLMQRLGTLFGLTAELFI